MGWRRFEEDPDSTHLIGLSLFCLHFFVPLSLYLPSRLLRPSSGTRLPLLGEKEGGERGRRRKTTRESDRERDFGEGGRKKMRKGGRTSKGIIAKFVPWYDKLLGDHLTLLQCIIRCLLHIHVRRYYILPLVSCLLSDLINRQRINDASCWNRTNTLGALVAATTNHPCELKMIN